MVLGEDPGLLEQSDSRDSSCWSLQCDTSCRLLHLKVSLGVVKESLSESLSVEVFSFPVSLHPTRSRDWWSGDVNVCTLVTKAEVPFLIYSSPLFYLKFGLFLTACENVQFKHLKLWYAYNMESFYFPSIVSSVSCIFWCSLSFPTHLCSSVNLSVINSRLLKSFSTSCFEYATLLFVCCFVFFFSLLFAVFLDFFHLWCPFAFWEQSSVECWCWPKETLSEREVCWPVGPSVAIITSHPRRALKLLDWMKGFHTCMVALSQHLCLPGTFLERSSSNQKTLQCMKVCDWPMQTLFVGLSHHVLNVLLFAPFWPGINSLREFRFDKQDSIMSFLREANKKHAHFHHS